MTFAICWSLFLIGCFVNVVACPWGMSLSHSSATIIKESFAQIHKSCGLKTVRHMLITVSWDEHVCNPRIPSCHLVSPSCMWVNYSCFFPADIHCLYIVLYLLTCSLTSSIWFPYASIAHHQDMQSLPVGMFSHYISTLCFHRLAHSLTKGLRSDPVYLLSDSHSSSTWDVLISLFLSFWSLLGPISKTHGSQWKDSCWFQWASDQAYIEHSHHLYLFLHSPIAQ